MKTLLVVVGILTFDRGGCGNPRTIALMQAE
jgi:hypothetical protein